MVGFWPYLPPALATATWAFFSRKQWSWVRFFITTLALTVVCFAGLVLWIETIRSPSSLPIISFSQKLPSSWILAVNHPITDKIGEPIGCEVFLKNEDKKRTILVYSRNSDGNLKTNVEKWRQNELNAWPSKSGFHVEEEEFRFDTISGRMVAQLRFRALKSNVTYHIFGQSWIQGRFFVFCDSVGAGIDVADDKEVADIISNIMVH